MHAQLRRDDGTTIAYDVAGDGPPVVFLHGLTSARGSWDPVTELLTAQLTCIRVDLRGHGASSPAEDYALPAVIADVRAVVEEVAAGEPAVVGHSYGATVAALYAAAYGARAVVTVDGSLRFGDVAVLVAPHADALRSERTMEAVMAVERALDLRGHPDLAAIQRRVLAFPREVVLGVWGPLLDRPPAELTATAEAVLRHLRAPLLALHGPPPPADYASWLTGLVPSATVEVWDGAGHMLHLAEPERFAARVRAFLAQA
ncbi:MAG TPA: alpha/beta hydrolase [Baekduia sp.]|nr:alpha/beta hydrolase [Baekduia sp.]